MILALSIGVCAWGWRSGPGPAASVQPAASPRLTALHLLTLQEDGSRADRFKQSLAIARAEMRSPDGQEDLVIPQYIGLGRRAHPVTPDIIIDRSRVQKIHRFCPRAE
ncbi:hypothetical protein AB4099_12325 [Bosea sp. 2KB_26]|uniref:hypothetical protein n=1 Tax=Bosea sp. 2KB_26 TaxID=3237475 RepID=UPI0013B01AC6